MTPQTKHPRTAWTSLVTCAGWQKSIYQTLLTQYTWRPLHIWETRGHDPVGYSDLSAYLCIFHSIQTGKRITAKLEEESTFPSSKETFFNNTDYSQYFLLLDKLREVKCHSAYVSPKKGNRVTDNWAVRPQGAAKITHQDALCLSLWTHNPTRNHINTHSGGG